MLLEAGIAWRYLWKKKSHGAVSAIAIVSVVGVAVAAAALLCVLSVFNGFRDVLTANNDRILSDIEVLPAHGKVILQGDSLAEVITHLDGVTECSPMVADQALALFEGREMPVMLRGVVAEAFSRTTAIDSLIVAGEPLPADAIDYDPPAGLLAAGVASRLRAYTADDHLLLFVPRREGRINPANPLASFHTDSVQPIGIFETMQTDYDLSSVIVPIDVARGLFQYEDGEATSLLVRTAPDVKINEICRGIMEVAGKDCIVRDRAQQQEMSFRMVNIEKWVTGLLLLFILVIASFNIISTMTMFVLEKRDDMRTFRALGMSRNSVGAIFGWESIYITLLGGGAGMILGIILCRLQENFGLLKMQAGEGTEMLVRSYPVHFLWQDLWAVALPILIIGLLTARIAASFARSRSEEKRQ